MIGKNIKGMDKDAKELVMNYMWPGNVRELQNTIEYAVIMAGSEYITASDLPERFRGGGKEEPEIMNQSQSIERNGNLKKQSDGEEEIVSISELERKEIEKAIRKFGRYKNDKELICKALGISKATLYRKMKAYDINQNESISSQ